MKDVINKVKGVYINIWYSNIVLWRKVMAFISISLVLIMGIICMPVLMVGVAIIKIFKKDAFNRT